MAIEVGPELIALVTAGGGGGFGVRYLWEKWSSRSHQNWKDASGIREELEKQRDYWKEQAEKHASSLTDSRKTATALEEQVKSKDELLREVRSDRQDAEAKLEKAIRSHKREIEDLIEKHDHKVRSLKVEHVDAVTSLERRIEVLREELSQARSLVNELARDVEMWEIAQNTQNGDGDTPISRDDLNSLVREVSEASVSERIERKMLSIGGRSSRNPERDLFNTPLFQDLKEEHGEAHDDSGKS